MLRFRALLGIQLAVLVVASPANGSVVQALELQELVDHADRIVLGRVLFSESFWTPNGQLGTWHRVEGEPSFTVGERVLVFMRDRGPYTAFRPVGMTQGVMRVRTEQGIETVRQNRRAVMLMRRNVQGRLERSLGALPEKQRLDALLLKLRDVVEQSAGGINE